MKNILFLTVLLSLSLHSQTPFSADSALSYLKTISGEIGPRPMGSPNERRVMEYSLAKFHEFGLTETWVMEMDSTRSEVKAGPVITRSGIAVGVLRGRTSRIIVIGGHMDSAGPEIAGANDDGSGSATVIELARVLSKRQNQHTIVFCLFGGEEQGLCGSRYFVEHFKDLDRVDLMLQVDMTNGTDWLMPLTDIYEHSTPEWLVKASYEEFDRLGCHGLSYPTHFLTLNNSYPGGAIGSDHEPFLEHDIPAIDFTSDINDPIHVPADNFENFQPAGLKRSGDLLYVLVARFDESIPAERTGNYYMFQIGMHPIFLSPWTVRVFIVIAVIAAVVAVVQVRKRRFETDKKQRPKIPALKLFLLMLVIQTCVWLSEDVVGFVKGERLPWFGDTRGYFVLAFIAATAGIWISLQVVEKLRISKDPYRWFLRSAIWLGVLTLIASLATTNLGLYPATALLCIACALLFRSSFLKLMFWLASPYLMYRLIFSEGFELMARSATSALSPALTTSLVLNAFYILFFSLWSFPFLLAFASIYYDSHSDLLWLKTFKKPAGILTAGTAIILTVLILGSRPTYNRLWSQILRVEEIADVSKGTGIVRVKSFDYLKGTTASYRGKDTTIASRTCEVTLDTISLDSARGWVTVQHALNVDKDSVTRLRLNAGIHSKYRPYSLFVTYSTGKGRFRDISTGLPAEITGRSVSYFWYSFPDTLIDVPLTCTLSGVDSLTETVEATFTQQVVPLKLQKEHSTTISRTIVRRTTVLHGPEQGRN